MSITDKKEWKSRLITPDKVLSKIKPGMSIFLGTGVAEPRTLIKSLMASDAGNLRDLEFIQLMSFGRGAYHCRRAICPSAQPPLCRCGLCCG